MLTSLQIAHNRLSTAADIEELVHCPKMLYETFTTTAQSHSLPAKSIMIVHLFKAEECSIILRPVRASHVCVTFFHW